MSNQRPDWLLLERFLAGEHSPAEAEQVRQWLDENPEATAALGLLRDAIDRQAPAEAAPPVWNVEAAWARLDSVTRADAGEQYRLPPPLRRIDGAGVEVGAAESAAPTSSPIRAPLNLGRVLRPASAWWLRVAAVLLLLGGGGVLLSRWAGDAADRVATTPSRVITTQRAERADLRLADGTHVVLAPESRLTISADFGRTRREVTLVGEGYFDVVHDAARPFLVRAAYGVVHDLGTRFSVRTYAADSVVRIVVAEGRVVAGLAGALLPAGGPVLERGDLARLDATGAVVVARGVDVDRYQSWIDGRLRFDATPLREVLPEVARWYDVDVELGDAAIGDRRLTLTLRNEPLVQVLSAIAYVTNTRYEQTGRVVRFSALRGTPPASRAP